MFHVALYLAYYKAGYSVAGAKAQALAYELMTDPVQVASTRLHVKHNGAGSLRLDENGRICGI
jgi:hypothetical protein